MGSRQPGVQHSSPLSSKGFPQENSTWCSLGQHFPGWLSPTPRASFSSSSHPNCPIKEQPRQQWRSYLRAALHLEGKRTGTIWILPLLPVWELKLEAAYCVLCESDCPHVTKWSFHGGGGNSSLWREKVLKDSASPSACHRMCVISKNALCSYFQRLSLILNWFLDYKTSQMCTVSPQKRDMAFSILSFHLTMELLSWHDFTELTVFFKIHFGKNCLWMKIRISLCPTF